MYDQYKTLSFYKITLTYDGCSEIIKNISLSKERILVKICINIDETPTNNETK